MPVEVTIPISVFELTVQYSKPNIRLMADRAAAVEALFAAFEPWNARLDDMEILSSGKPSEQGVQIKIATVSATFFFSATQCKFVKNAALWAEADQILEVLGAGLTALQKATGVTYADRVAIFSLHLQPKTVQFRDLLRRFLVPEILALSSEQNTATAVVSRWPTYRLTLDASGALANGIFAQSERQLDATSSLDAMKEIVLQDQLALFKLLDIQEVGS